MCILSKLCITVLTLGVSVVQGTLRSGRTLRHELYFDRALVFLSNRFERSFRAACYILLIFFVFVLRTHLGHHLGT